MRRIQINLRFINIALIFIITNVFICNAQEVKPDKIFKNDGTKIESKVLEITPNEIKYKKFSNLVGPNLLDIQNKFPSETVLLTPKTVVSI